MNKGWKSHLLHRMTMVSLMNNYLTEQEELCYNVTDAKEYR